MSQTMTTGRLSPCVRALPGDDPVELQRRLEAFLLIAQRVEPAMRGASA